MKAFIENWSMVMFLMGSLVALGGILYNLRSLNAWKEKTDTRLNPSKPGDMIVTFEACLQCQLRCQNNNAATLSKIEATLVRHGDILQSISNQVNRNEGAGEGRRETDHKG